MARKRLKNIPTLIEHEILIKSWNYKYGFSIDNSYRPEEPFPKYDNLEIEGELKSDSYKIAKNTFITLAGRTPDNFVYQNKQDQLSKSIGYISASKQLLQYYVFMPEEDLNRILLMLHLKNFNFLYINAEKLHYNKARIKGFSFCLNKQE